MAQKHQLVPMDPELRAKALKIIDAYKNESTVPASKEPADLLRAGVPIAMRTIGEMIETYERGELGTTAQKQLMSTMRKLVKKYG